MPDIHEEARNEKKIKISFKDHEVHDLVALSQPVVDAKARLEEQGYEIVDCGCTISERGDYAAEFVLKGKKDETK